MIPTVEPKDLCSSCGRHGHHSYRCAHRGTPAEILDQALSTPRCVSCGSKISHYSHCAFYRGNPAEPRLTLADRALLERHAAELFVMTQPVSDAVRAECVAEMARAGFPCS